MATPIIREAPALLKGYSASQIQRIFEEIASYAHTLASLQRKIVSGLNDPLEEFDIPTYVDASVILATTIGSLADRASGEGIYGTVEDWHCGPNFRNLHAEGGAK